MEDFNFVLKKYPQWVHKATAGEDDTINVEWNKEYLKSLTWLGDDVWTSTNRAFVKPWLADGGWIKVVEGDEDRMFQILFLGLQIEAAQKTINELKIEVERLKLGK